MRKVEWCERTCNFDYAVLVCHSNEEEKKVKEKDGCLSKQKSRERERERSEESGEQARKIKQRNVCLTLIFFILLCAMIVITKISA